MATAKVVGEMCECECKCEETMELEIYIVGEELYAFCEQCDVNH